MPSNVGPYATIEPATARQKRMVAVPGEMEADFIHDRRPEFYGLIAQATG